MTYEEWKKSKAANSKTESKSTNESSNTITYAQWKQKRANDIQKTAEYQQQKTEEAIAKYVPYSQTAEAAKNREAKRDIAWASQLTPEEAEQRVKTARKEYRQAQRDANRAVRRFDDDYVSTSASYKTLLDNARKSRDIAYENAANQEREGNFGKQDVTVKSVANNLWNGVKNTGRNLFGGTVSNIGGILNSAGYLAQDLIAQQAQNEANKSVALNNALSAIGSDAYSGVAKTESELANTQQKNDLNTATDIGKDFNAKTNFDTRNAGFIEKGIYDVAQGVGGMVPSIAANLILPGSGLPVMFTYAAGNATEEALNSGASKEAATLYGVAVGGIEVITEKMFGGIPGLGVGSVDKAVENAIVKYAKNPATQVAMTYLVDALGEGFEEFVSEFADRWVDKLLIKTDDRTMGETFNAALYSFLIGALTSSVLSISPATMKTMKAAQIRKTINDNIDNYYAQATENGLFSNQASTAATDARTKINNEAQRTMPKYQAPTEKQIELRSDTEAKTVAVAAENYQKNGMHAAADAVTKAVEGETDMVFKAREFMNAYTQFRNGAETVTGTTLTQAQLNMAREAAIADNAASSVSYQTNSSDNTIDLNSEISYTDNGSATETNLSQPVQAATTEGVNANVQTQEQSSIGNQGRTDSVSPAGQSSGVAKAREYVRRRETQNRVAASRRDARIAQGEDKVSPASVGISDGNHINTMLIVSAENAVVKNDTELQNIEQMKKQINQQRYLNGEQQIDLVYYVGEAGLKDGGTARGYHQGNKIFVRIDSTGATATEIFLHEYCHDLIANEIAKTGKSATFERVRDEILSHDDSETLDMLEHYAELYRGVLNSDEVLEEIVCDAYAGIDIWAHKTRATAATRYTETARSAFVKAKESRNAETNRNTQTETRNEEPAKETKTEAEEQPASQTEAIQKIADIDSEYDSIEAQIVELYDQMNALDDGRIFVSKKKADAKKESKADIQSKIDALEERKKYILSQRWQMISQYEKTYGTDLYQTEIDKYKNQAGNESLEQKVENEEPLTMEEEGRASREFDEKYMKEAVKENKKSGFVSDDVMNKAAEQRTKVKGWLDKISHLLPPDIVGKTFISDKSYGGTEELSTECIRTMAADELMDAVADYLGRPLTVDDTIEISQEIFKYTDKPECLYCYVAMDRKAYREFTGEYLKMRDAAIADIKSGMDKDAAYQKYLNGRKDTKDQQKRFDIWYNAAKSGKPLLNARQLSNTENALKAAKISGNMKEQVQDALKYAQAASWAKKRISYAAYNNHILKWKQQKIDDLNSHYGLRLYSFSDYSPAFLLENMQMVTDAAVRGLKCLSYTKELDYAKIFAPTGMNINISVFAYQDWNTGEYASDGMQGADWEEAKKLRKKYSNVGCTFVAVNDAQVEWALNQDWIDVIIPFHMVRTGTKVAKYFGWENYTQMSRDLKTKQWNKDTDVASITPAMHQNNKQMYLDACEKNHLTPRFAKWVEHPNYMKLVNETRQSDGNTKPVQPVFDLKVAKSSIDEMAKRGGYYQHIGGSFENMLEIAKETGDKLNGKASREESEQKFDPNKAKEFFGTTTDPYTASYLLRDGSMLSSVNKDNWIGMDSEWFDDLKKEYGLKVAEHIDHDWIDMAYEDGEFESSDAISEFVSDGNIRLIINERPSDQSGFQLSADVRPTEKQYEMIESISDSAFNNGQNVFVGYEDGEKGYEVFDKTASGRDVVNNIKYFYANGKTRSDLNKFRGRYSRETDDGTIQKFSDEREKANLYFLEGQKLFDAEMELYSKYQDGVANKDTFFKNTIAEFKRISRRPSGEPDYVSYGRNGKVSSEYWYRDDGVVRGSNHWGLDIRSCDWKLEGVGLMKQGVNHTNKLYGFCKWEDFVLKTDIYGAKRGSDYRYTDFSEAELSTFANNKSNEARYSRDDAEYLELAKDPEANIAKLKNMILVAAKKAMPNTKAAKKDGTPIVLYHGTPNKDSFYTFKDGSVFMFSKANYADQYTHYRRDISVNPKQTGRIMPVFANIENPLIVDANRHLWRNIDVDWSNTPVTTDDIVSYAKEHGHDGVIIKNVRDNMFDDDNGYCTEYVAFDASQVKSAGPTYKNQRRENYPLENRDVLTNEIGVTYDNKGNVIPLSERFDFGKNDIRYSREDDLARENDKLRKQVEYWRGQTKLTPMTKIKPEDVRRVGRELLNQYQSIADVKEITPMLQKLYDGLSEGMDSVEAYDLAEQISEIICDGVLIRERSDYDEIMEILSGRKIKVAEETKRGMDGYGEFRRRNLWLMKLGNTGTEVSAFYSKELAENYPGYFPPNITNPADQLLQIEEIVNQLRPKYVSPISHFYDEALDETTNEILERFFETDQVKTYADRMNQRILKAKLNTAVRQQRFNESMQKFREQRDRQINDLKDRHFAAEKREKDRRTSSALRNKIVSHCKSMSNLLTRPTDKKHIPQELQGAVAKLLESINLSSKYEYAYGRDAMWAKVELGTVLGAEQTKRSEAFAKLKKVYQQMQEDLVVDPELLGDDTVGGLFDDVIALGDKSIDAMTVEELTTVWKTMRAVEASIRSANKMFEKSKYERVSDAAEALQEDNSGKTEKPEYRGVFGKVQRLLTIDMLTPESYFHILGKSGDNLFRMLRDAQDKYIRLMDKAHKFTEAYSKVNVKQLDNELHEVTLGGRNVTLSTSQIMELYVLMNREQAIGHILAGGILPTTTKGKGIKLNRVSEAISGLDISEVQKVINLLTADQKKLADEMQKFLSAECSSWGNEASMAVYGYKKFGETNYWPIKVNSQTTKSDPGSETQVVSIGNKGMTKLVKPGAKNSVMLGSIFDTFSRHIGEMADYAAYLQVSEDINRIQNFKFKNEDGVPNNETVKGILDRVHGNGGKEYIQKLLTDLAIGVKSDSNFMSGLFGNVKASSVAGNIRVVIQQPTAILRALDMLDAKYLATRKNPKTGWEKAKKYAPIAQWKDWGYFDVSSGMTTKSLLFDNTTALDRMNDKLMAPAGLADAVSWGHLWNCCEEEIKDKTNLKPDTAEFYHKVAERFTEIIDHTQVVDGILQRSQIMRSSSGFDKMATSFMGEPTKQLNMMYTALYDLTHASSDSAKTAAKKRLRRTATSLLVSGFVNAIAQSIVDALRDDDKDQAYWQKFLEAFTGFTGDEDSFGDYFSAIMNGNIESVVNIPQYIPYIKDIVSILQGYEAKRMDYDSISKVITSGKNLISAISGNGRYTVPAALIDLTGSVSRLYGIPLVNLKRDVMSFVDSAAQWSNAYMFQYYLLKMEYKMDHKSNTSKYYELLYEAKKNDSAAYNEIYRKMISDGFKKENIESSMTSRSKKESE